MREGSPTPGSSLGDLRPELRPYTVSMAARAATLLMGKHNLSERTRRVRSV